MSSILALRNIHTCAELVTNTISLLRSQHHTVIDVNDPHLAARHLLVDRPDLFLVDAGASGYGFSVVDFLRKHVPHSLPVVMLSCQPERVWVIRARALKVQEYLLKAQLSPELLLRHLQKYLQPAGPAERQLPQPAGRRPIACAKNEAAKTSPAPPETPMPSAPSMGPSLTRDQTLDRIRRYTESKTLAGAVGRVLSFANSSRGSLSDLVALLKQDTVLATRILHVANSAAFASKKPSISTVEEAVRNVGLNTVRTVAMSVGIFQSFPPDREDGFNTIRCWQHCFAAAALMDHLAADQDAADGVAHLVGLCHDLPEIVLRTCFAEEYSTIVQNSQSTGGSSFHQMEAELLGVRRHELIQAILRGLSLPDEIAGPIIAYSSASIAHPAQMPPMGRLLALADIYAHGMLLAPSTDAPLRPFTIAECRNIFAHDYPSPVDPTAIRNDVLMTTLMLARLSAADEKRLEQALVPESDMHVWYARHKAFDAWDPLQVALQLLCQVQTHDHLPESVSEMEDAEIIIAVVPRTDMEGFRTADFARLASEAPRPSALLTPSGKTGSSAPIASVTTEQLPLTIAALGQLLTTMRNAAAAPTESVLTA